MLTVLIRVLCALPAILFFYQGVNWLFQPEEAAAGLGMPLLTGIGASTQIGELGICLGRGKRHSENQGLQSFAAAAGGLDLSPEPVDGQKI